MLSIFLLYLSFINSCTHYESLQEKFNTLKEIDYAEFNDMSIVNRKGVYFVTYRGSTYKIEINYFTESITSIERAFSEEKGILLTKKETDYIEKALKSFDKIGVIVLSVDEKGNVFLTLPWYDKCSYRFLRLSPTNSLEEIKKTYYQNYEDNWYMDKECAE